MLLLTEQELYLLTGYKRRGAQRQALNRMAITHKIRPDGRIIVLQSHIEKIMGGNDKAKEQEKSEPNFEALNA